MSGAGVATVREPPPFSLQARLRVSGQVSRFRPSFALQIKLRAGRPTPVSPPGSLHLRGPMGRDAAGRPVALCPSHPSSSWLGRVRDGEHLCAPPLVAPPRERGTGRNRPRCARPSGRRERGVFGARRIVILRYSPCSGPLSLFSPCPLRDASPPPSIPRGVTPPGGRSWGLRPVFPLPCPGAAGAPGQLSPGRDRPHFHKQEKRT